MAFPAPTAQRNSEAATLTSSTVSLGLAPQRWQRPYQMQKRILSSGKLLPGQQPVAPLSAAAAICSRTPARSGGAAPVGERNTEYKPSGMLCSVTKVSPAGHSVWQG